MLPPTMPVSAARPTTRVLRSRENERRRREPLGQERRDQPRGRPVRRGQAGEDGVRLEEDVGRHARTPRERRRGARVALVPRGEGRHDDARVDGDHRRVRSSVSRTRSSVSGGSFSPGTATAPPARRTRVIAVGAGSISMRPSRSRISSALPRRIPSLSRRSLRDDDATGSVHRGPHCQYSTTRSGTCRPHGRSPARERRGSPARAGVRSAGRLLPEAGLTRERRSSRTIDVVFRFDPDRPARRRAPRSPRRRGEAAEGQPLVRAPARPPRERARHPARPGRRRHGSEPGVAPVQRPFAAVLGCSDARVPIETIFEQKSNDLFVVRVAGNGVGSGCLGSLRYAVDNFPRASSWSWSSATPSAGP